jgi:maltose alpha-D-glucosyltransferase / alpha-amylase
MQWSIDRNAGFSRADSARLYAPVISDPIYGYMAVNVEAQERLPSSLLNWMKMLIRLQKANKVFGLGTTEFLKPQNTKVLAYIRSWEDQQVLCVNNLSRFSQYAELDLSAYNGRTPVDMFGNTPFPKIGDLPYLVTMGPHSFYWFRLMA